VLAIILGAVSLVGIFTFNIKPTLVEGTIAMVVLCVILFVTRVIIIDDLRRLARYGKRAVQRMIPKRRRAKKPSQEQLSDPSVSVPM
jgi:hypothetical protein